MAGRKKVLCWAALGVAAVLAALLMINIFSDHGAYQFLPLSACAAEMAEVTSNEKGVMENQRFTLTLDEDTLGITLKDKASGQIWRSTQDYKEGNTMWRGIAGSGLSFEFYKPGSILPFTVSPLTEKPEVQIQYRADGFDANLYYDAYSFRMQLQVRLTEDGFTALIPGNSIEEGEDFLIGGIYLYPMLGATVADEEPGYMVIPEGVGGIIELRDNQGKFSAAYSKRIYGTNVGVDPVATSRWGVPSITEPEAVTMPVFGMVYTEKESGFLGIVTEGDNNATLTAYPNGVVTPYNWVTAKFNIRSVYTKQTARQTGVASVEAGGDIRDLGMRYIFVNGEDADYMGLAHRYQQYLVDAGTLTKQKDHFQVKLDFLGADVKKWLVWDMLVPMTTVDDMEAILTALLDSGVTDILPVYFGWQEDGVTKGYGASSLKIEGALGSDGALKKLSDTLAERGVALTLQQDLLLANTSRLYNTSTDIVKSVSQSLVETPTNQEMFPTMYYLTPTGAMELAEDFSKRYGDVVDQVCISGITDNLYSFYSSGTVYSRDECAAQYRDVMESLPWNRIAMTAPNANLWDRMSQYYDLTTSTSNYNFITREIPFLPTVLRGYVPYWADYTNFQSNQQESYLKLLECGAYPSFLVTAESPVELRDTNSSYIYTSEFSTLESRIREYAAEIGSVLSRVEGAGIAKHASLADNVVYVEYENGLSMIINYNHRDYTDGQISVPALSYTITGEEVGA